MRIAVELRRNNGRWLDASTRAHRGIAGELMTGRKEFEGRVFPFLHLTRVESLSQDLAPPEEPKLFEPRIARLDGGEFLVQGMEYRDRAWTLQEWDCVLPESARRVRVERRRNAGRWIARFRKQTGFVGQLATGRREIEGRVFSYLYLTSMEPSTHGVPPPATPLLFEPRIWDILGSEFHLLGSEYHELSWTLQEWDCEFLELGQSGYR